MNQRRIPEIDLFRALALTLMILYHFIYDLDTWTSLPIQVGDWGWFIVGKTAALIFIFLSGISCGLARSSWKNGIKVFLWGLVITLVTRFVLPEEYVRFGILHLLGIMMIIYPLVKRLPNFFLLFCAFLALGLGFYFSSQAIDTFWLLPFGLKYPEFATMDYYPLFPYGGVSLLGILFYRTFIAKSRTSPAQEKSSSPRPAAEILVRFPLIQKISRHSLGIYLIHQPILLGLIFGAKMLFSWTSK